MADSRKVNDAYWRDRVAAHAASPEYGLARFAEDPRHLSEVVAFDRLRLGDVRGLRGRPPAVQLADRPERLPASYTLQARRIP